MIVIERFEGELVLLEIDGKIYQLPRNLLPETAKAGDLLNIEISVDAEATAARRSQITSLWERLQKR
ncbi:MAG: DUF3006 domain-containing protein [Bacillota bacterium]|jgi:hypothetical protein